MGYEVLLAPEAVEDLQRLKAIHKPENLRRLLGDPAKGVEVGPNSSLASFISVRQDQK